MIRKLFILLTLASCSPKPLFLKQDDFTVEVLSFKPEVTRSYAIIIPPTGGTNFIDRSYASGLAKHGIHTYVLSHWTGDDEYKLELSIHNRFYHRALKAIGIVLKEIPKDAHVGILGTSVGGIHAAIAASRYPELSSAFIITGGAHIPSIIANSNQDVMKDAWTQRAKLFNFKDKGEYISALEKEIDLEPLNRLAMTSPKNFGLVIATADETVPTINQERLSSLWKPEKIIYKDHDHFWSIISTWLFNAGEIYTFFEAPKITNQ
jgi:pimeloyl-ACP methyl ester carboxylesterase